MAYNNTETQIWGNLTKRWNQMNRCTSLTFKRQFRKLSRFWKFLKAKQKDKTWQIKLKIERSTFHIYVICLLSNLWCSSLPASSIVNRQILWPPPPPLCFATFLLLLLSLLMVASLSSSSSLNTLIVRCRAATASFSIPDAVWVLLSMFSRRCVSADAQISRTLAHMCSTPHSLPTLAGE